MIVGMGSRSSMYQDAVEKKYQATAELVGFCDTNPGRLKLAQGRSAKNGAKAPPAFAAADFDRMVAEVKPDTVIVTTMDSTHHIYVVRGMQLGCDVITEKPMTTDAEKCQQVIDAQRQTGKKCTVTFNYRYSPPRSQVKDLLVKGTIGDVLSVDFHWLLNTHHGADYFRRWHGRKMNSGGLMVHKATHHFDLVNWWLSAIPVEVMAQGKREYYTPETARRLGLKSHHERCLTCPEKKECAFYMDLTKSEGLRTLYLENEQYDGYFRDRCVFRPEIDIEDTMHVTVKYDTGPMLSYSLNAMNAWEGYTIAFNGTKGRIEHQMVEKIYVSGTNTVQGAVDQEGVKTVVYPLRGSPQEVEPWSGEGSHGGGDAVMLDDIFLLNPPADPLQRAADQRGGAYSILTGIAANLSFETHKAVRIPHLVHNIGYPPYAVMPTRVDPLGMP